MRPAWTVFAGAVVLATGCTRKTAPAGRGEGLDTAAIERLTGLSGTRNESEGVFKVTAPRADVPISVDGRPMQPFLGFTSWAAFTSGRDAEGMVMGDLVLFQDEVNPVMDAALGAGLEVTALHNHFLFDEPRVYFMHIAGEGGVETLASGVRAALDRVREIRARTPAPAPSFGDTPLPATSSVTPGPLEEILRTKGQAKDGMFKAVFGRTVRMPCGCQIGRDMGVNTWAAFAGTDEDAAVDGDFAVLEGELQDVLRSLRRSGIRVVAIHQHMTGESPRMIFLHYWGRGRARDLAEALRSALDLLGNP